MNQQKNMKSNSGGEKRRQSPKTTPTTNHLLHRQSAPSPSPKHQSTSSILKWTCEDVAAWLSENDFDDYVDLLANTHRIDGLALLVLTEDDMKTPPVNMSVLGDVKRLALAIDRLKQEDWLGRSNGNKKNELNMEEEEMLRQRPSLSPRQSLHQISPILDVTDFSNGRANGNKTRAQSFCYKPSYINTILSWLYLVMVTLVTSFVMVICHNRVPEKSAYPPLPDVMLDNIPYIHWAFSASEFAALILFAIWWLIIVFHKYRLIVIHRSMIMTGTVFLLRCSTMFMTSLSVPGEHLQCSHKVANDWFGIAKHAIAIWTGGGMTITGVHTCGDYMFSDTPRSYYILHTLCWVLNLFGIFFILAAHEHYSIDVFIAFYITTRLFLYYHTLANNRSLKQSGEKRMRIWFPMFSYFEKDVDGPVPNEYEWPVALPKFLTQKKSLGKRQ